VKPVYVKVPLRDGSRPYLTRESDIHLHVLGWRILEDA
jgi:hypothetical protein